MDNRSKDMMIMLAHLVKPNDGMKHKLLTIRGVPLWYPVPASQRSRNGEASEDAAELAKIQDRNGRLHGADN